MLGDLPVFEKDDRVLVDYRTSDDAGVYRLDERRALVQTVDFFTPVVDDPVAYGRIAGANALSDIYAMGGRPLTALAIAGFPKDADRGVLSQIFQGGLQALREAGVALLGGHTVQDQEIKFGYAITGEVDPARMWTNAGARAWRSPAADQGSWDGCDRDGHQVRPHGSADRRRSDRLDGAAQQSSRGGARGRSTQGPFTRAPMSLASD